MTKAELLKLYSKHPDFVPYGVSKNWAYKHKVNHRKPTLITGNLQYDMFWLFRHTTELTPQQLKFIGFNDYLA